jgi:arylsulfatase A-like enzyme
MKLKFLMSIRRNFFYKTLMVFGISTVSHFLYATDNEDGRPNIVFILTDQWRASATGYSGDPNVRTPNLDRLADESFNFVNTISVCPVCTPYRASLLTGKYPTSTGMFLNDAHLPDKELCIAEVLKTEGYQTAYIGKWHLDGHGRSDYIPPERRQGFEYWKGAECDHNYNRSHYYAGSSDKKMFWEGYDVFAQTKDAQKYILKHGDNDKPFFLFVSYGTPHFPHETAPEKFKANYPPEKIILPANVPDSMRAQARKEAQGYYAHCEALDQSIGKLLSTLDESGLRENTIVIFTSDHGEMMGSHGVPPKQKQVPWNESAGVPFLLRYPALHGEKAKEIEMPIVTPDIFPTLLGLTNLSIPKTIEGDDLSFVIKKGKEKEKRAVLYMGVAPFARHNSKELKEYRAIKTAQFTYVRSLNGPWLLYDDVNDPLQMNNLIGDAKNADLHRRMERLLQSKLDEINDDFRDGDHYIKEWGYKPASHGSLPYSGNKIKPQTPSRINR